MQSKYWTKCIYPLFLSTLSSCTFAAYTDAELNGELDNLARRAIAKFKFPKVALDYEYDWRPNTEPELTDDEIANGIMPLCMPFPPCIHPSKGDDTTDEEEDSGDSGPTVIMPDPATSTPHGYYFLNDVTMKEIIVIIAWMKVYWLEYQQSKERNYVNLYADKDVKAFSSGNLIQSIDKAYTTFWNYARKEEEDYSRVNASGRPAIGDVNAD